MLTIDQIKRTLTFSIPHDQANQDGATYAQDRKAPDCPWYRAVPDESGNLSYWVAMTGNSYRTPDQIPERDWTEIAD